MDILSIVRAYGLPVEFDPKVMTQVEHVAKPVSEADMAGRMDLRDWQMVTIDGEDAKDLDDAVSLTIDMKIIFWVCILRMCPIMCRSTVLLTRKR